ncbi:MAG: hypothetical protein H0X13_15600 [Ramlibacter sp.]|nr:hypothetical protein [Ramlibacter sp.]
MSATRQAATLIAQRGSGTVDAILPEMQGYSRDQVLRALKAAAERGLITCDGNKQTPGVHGGTPATYRAIVRRPAASSIWQYASAAVAPQGTP